MGTRVDDRVHGDGREKGNGDLRGRRRHDWQSETDELARQGYEYGGRKGGKEMGYMGA